MFQAEVVHNCIMSCHC